LRLKAENSLLLLYVIAENDCCIWCNGSRE
jgi:hypothetical protein